MQLHEARLIDRESLNEDLLKIEIGASGYYPNCQSEDMIGKNISSSSDHSSGRVTTLFCVPNAGGTVMMYKHWRPLLHPSVNLRLLELAGRGRRFQERCYDDMSEAVEDLYGLIEQQLSEGDFAFFGHSMGAMLCYELISKIWTKRKLAPVHAFLSGRVPPNSQEDIKILHHLSDARLMAEVKRWGGFSPQQLADKTLENIPVYPARFQF